MKEIPWMEGPWAELLRLRTRLPHALLLQGPAGVGAAALALEFAGALLCEAPGPGGEACRRCPACNWLAQGNHPDFRLVQPESMAPAGPEEEPGRKKSDQIRIDRRHSSAWERIGAGCASSSCTRPRR
jgi:DNA polymerase-3 subunit delta'